jgi:antibiotic biosynthesis monooxygenase (ABM) superfamily enzyme
MTEAAAFTILHPAPDRQGFDAWVADLRAVANEAPGFVDVASAVAGDGLDWALMVTFRTEDLLHEWLDGDGWARALRDAESAGIRRLSTDLVVVEGATKATGVAVFRHSVAPGKDADFMAAQARLTRVSSRFPGYEGTAVFPPGASGEWMSLMRFRTENQLSAWLKSRQRKQALPSLRSNLTKDFSVVSQTTPFGTTVRTVNGKTEMTPKWKTAMLLLMVLYPTVMLLSRFLGPVLSKGGAAPWVAMWISQVASVSLLQWWLMPAVSASFRRWLDPVDGAGLRISLRGAAAVLFVYAATLALFATVQWLQYWDYH